MIDCSHRAIRETITDLPLITANFLMGCCVVPSGNKYSLQIVPTKKIHLLLYITFLEVAVEVNFPISSENKDMIESLKQDDNIVKAMRTSKVC